MLAICGGKGGVGKTTTTLGLALAHDGPAVAVDADVDMPNLHAMAGVPRRPEAGDTERGQSAGGGATATPTREQSVTEGVRVVPAAFGATTPPEVSEWLTGVRATVGSGTSVFVDCPAGASPDAVAPMRVADGALLVADRCGPSLRDAAKTAAMARAVGTPVLGAVVTRALTVPEAVGDLLGCSVVATVPEARSSSVLDDDRVRAAYGDLCRRLSGERDDV